MLHHLQKYEFFDKPFVDVFCNERESPYCYQIQILVALVVGAFAELVAMNEREIK